MTSKKLKLKSPEETVQVQETERGDWDGLPQEVLNMIFSHLPARDLFSCSVMSKNWKKASRDVLKRSRECYAHIKHFRRDVRSLSYMIASTDLMEMINGLHIQIRPKINSRKAAPSVSWYQEFSCSYAENILQSKYTRRRLDKAKQKLQAVLCGRWKFLNLDMGHYSNWDLALSIDDALLLRELISEATGSLQKVVVGDEMDCFFMSCCGKEFPKLKVLHNQDEDSIYQCFSEEFLLEFAPNLEEITGGLRGVEVHSPGNPFMLKRMKSIMVVPDLIIPEPERMESFRSISGLYRLNLQVYHCKNPDDVTFLFSMVLRSLSTLEELYMCTSEVYELFKTSDEIEFQKLRRLNLASHCGMPIEDEISVLQLLNLPKLCPNLEHLELAVNEYVNFHDEEEENSFEVPYGVDKSDLPLQIELECRQGLYHHEHLEFLSQIYPKMNKVKVLKWEPGDNSEMNNIFSDVHSLEYLEINVSLGYYSEGDPDVAIAAILCGINVQEAKFLFCRRPKKNAKLHPYIVPIHPSVFNAKNLKELKISGEGWHYSGSLITHSWVIQITENLPVRHVRNLKVTFEGKEGLYNKLNDLRALTTLLRAQVKGN